MQKIIGLAAAAREFAIDTFDQFGKQSPEAEQEAIAMIRDGQARLRIDIAMGRPDDGMVVRVLLEPLADEGEPVELSVMPESAATTPSAQGVASRIWFFGRLSHWQTPQ